MQNYKQIKVVGGLIYKKSQLLVCRRAIDKDQGGLWEVPGGKVEEGEADEMALFREIKEELDLEVLVEQHIATSVVQNKTTQIQMKVYSCSIIDGLKQDNIVSTDHDKVQWISKEEIFDLKWAIADVPILDDFHRFLSQLERTPMS